MTKEQFKHLVQTIGYSNAIDTLKVELNFNTNLPIKIIESSESLSLEINYKASKGLVPNSIKKYENTINYSKNSKKLRARKKKERLKTRKIVENKLKQFDKTKPLPKSELWFRSLYDEHFKCETDLYNETFMGKYLPDVVNHHFKYIIEVDGSVHDLIEVKARDFNKTKFYKKHHYKVYRLKAYSIPQYINLIKSLSQKRRNSQPSESFNQFVLQYTKKQVNL